jgi:UDP-N-acetylglucosamine transferase subunit ALG13
MNKRLFLSVGSRFPMDRLLNATESFVQKHQNFDAFAQTGDSKSNTVHIKSQPWLSEEDFKKELTRCDIFISHAGMGNILLAASTGKPIIIMPRRKEFDEHINDHQLDTAKEIKQNAFTYVVNDFEELETAILSIVSEKITDGISNKTASAARINLISALKQYIDHERA